MVKKYKLIFLCISVFMQISYLSAQNKQVIDSIMNVLENTTDERAKVAILIDLSTEYSNNTPQEAEKYVKQALSLAKRINYKTGEAFSYWIMSQQAQSQADYPKASNYGHEALVLYIEIKDSSRIANSYFSLGALQAYQGNYLESIEFIKKSLVINEALGNLKGVSDCLNNIGVVYNFQGNHVKSIEYQEKSLKVCRELGDRRGVSIRLTNLGASYDELSNYSKALSCYEDAIEIKRELEDKNGISVCLNNMGEVYKDKGDYVEAIEYYEKSLKIDKELEDQAGISICLLNIGEIHFLQNDFLKASEYFNNSLKIANEIGDKRVIANNLNNIGKIFIKQKKYDLATNNFIESIELSEEMESKTEMATSFFYLGNVYIEQGKYNDAIEQYEMAYEIHEELGEEGNLATDNIKIGEAWYKMENYNNAIRFSTKGLNIAQKIGSKDNVSKASKVLSKSYARLMYFQKAYEYSVLYKETHDSIYTIESQKHISAIEHSFELERKQQEIELQNIKLEKQDTEINQQKIKQKALLGGLFSVLIIVVLVLIGNIRIRKAKDIITEQKEEIQVSNENLNNTNEELRVTLEMLSQQKELIEKTNKEITDSIHYAKYIQSAILPQNKKIERIFNDYFVMYKPKDIVSGDFYWTTKIDKKIVLAGADCTGHGVPGAFMSILGISLLNDIINKEGITKTDIVLNTLRIEIISALQQKSVLGEQLDGMDIGLCSIDFKKMTLQFSGANRPLYVIRSKDKEPIQSSNIMELGDSVLYEIKGDKMPIALYIKMVDFSLKEIKLHKGDCLYMFSDGFTDQFGGPNAKRYQSKKFKQLLLANCEKPMSEQKNKLENAFLSWKHNQEQIDDIMVVGFTV